MYLFPSGLPDDPTVTKYHVRGVLGCRHEHDQPARRHAGAQIFQLHRLLPQAPNQTTASPRDFPETHGPKLRPHRTLPTRAGTPPVLSTVC